MLTVQYEDRDLIVVEKPSGMESQSSRGFEPDVVSLIQNHLARTGENSGKISTNLSTNWGKLSTKQVQNSQPPYVAVIHRLDRPVSGVMVYAKTKKAAAALSSQVRDGRMEKIYYAVVCGKPVDPVSNYVDYLRKDGKTNRTEIVDKGTEGGKRAELEYEVVETVTEGGGPGELSLIRIRLLTGRHHQIRVQFAGHGTPLWGDNRYNPDFASGNCKGSIALCAAGLSFTHPFSGKKMGFWMEPRGEAFSWFSRESLNLCRLSGGGVFR